MDGQMRVAVLVVAWAVITLIGGIVTRAVKANDVDPTPDPAAVIQSGQARFTVLTDFVIRMQYGQTHDEPTFSFVNRRQPVPKFQQSTEGGWLTIKTAQLQLSYLTSSKVSFNQDNLQVSVPSTHRTWKPIPTFNITLQGNLLGTSRTLDRTDGAADMDLDCLTNREPDLHCTLGLISEWGYVVVDDTGRPRFDHDSEWPWLTQPNIPSPSKEQCDIANISRRDCGHIGISTMDCLGKGCCLREHEQMNGVPRCYYPKNAQQDLYFFGHGHNYTQALKDFTSIAGKVPMPPRFAFGLIYSRYWAYSDFGEMQIVNQFQDHSLPLSAVVSDMDWHITFYDNVKDQAGERRGWTGFTWDKHLFPDATKYLAWCKSRGLKNTLNLHPASGVQPWEDKYAEMAEACGIDPKTGHYVPFVPQNKTFVTNWNKIVLAAREKEGIDFWWLDWQQGENWINVTGVNPTFWLNYIFYTNPYHWKVDGKDQRGMLLHRFGGLGNHRYQVGFSGDVHVSWDSLDYQVYYTIKATNVAFGYWSHDLGGHVGASPPELYTRWIQFGTFSPIFRIHAKKDGFMWRRPWLYPHNNYDILMKFFLLRASLVPYIYTASRQAYDTGLCVMRAMYYSEPDNPLSYTYDHQYLFGDDFLVAPVTSPLNPVYNTSRKSVFLPPTTVFVHWKSGEVFKNVPELARNYTLAETPVFVRAGSIIPMVPRADLTLGSSKELPTTLRLVAYIAGGILMSGSGHVYEDDGSSNAYKNGAHSTMDFVFSYDKSLPATISFNIGPASYSFPGMLQQRKYEIVLQGVWPVKSASVDGKELTIVQYDTGCAALHGCCAYDGTSLSVEITTTSLLTNQSHEVIIGLISPLPSTLLQSNFTGRLRRLAEAKELLDNQWGIHTIHQQDYYSLLLAGETGMRITYTPDTVQEELTSFPQLLQQARSEVAALSLSESGDLRSNVLELLS